MSEVPDTPQAGASVYGLPAPLGKYTLVERLGVGGMAEVFLATHNDLISPPTRHVVKRCLPHLLEDARFIEMFLREGRTAARLHHENVVELHEIGHVGNSYFLVLEYIDGITLRKLALRAWGHKKTLPMELIVSAVADAALGLHHAHTLKNEDGTAVNLVHRDVSPENLMINRQGLTKVLDFGIARAADSTALTKTGELKGKIPFLSPEQIKGGAIDARADVYALGVTFYWLLAGRRPHRAPTELALLNEILFTPVHAPSKYNDKIPPEIDELVMAMIDRDRDLRPATALMVHEILKENLKHRETHVAPFVNELMAMPDAKNPDPIADPEEVTDVAVLPATPLTQIHLSKWQRATKAPDEDLPVHVDDGAVSGVEPPPSQRPKQLIAAVAAGGAMLAIIAVVALSRSDPDPAPAVADAGPAPVAYVDAGALPPEPPPADPAPVVADPPPVDDTPKAVKLRSVQLKGPAHIAWSIAKGVSAKSGSSAEVPASMRSVRAVDKQTGGVSNVPIDAQGVADYGKLGTGTLEVRALPFAKVKIGALDLGTTPFAPKSLVEGSYEVKLSYESSTEKRSIKIAKGKTERIVVDFRKK